jgi:hypothetical protein
LAARPSASTLDRVGALLDDLYGRSATLTVDEADRTVRVTVNLPYEHA